MKYNYVDHFYYLIECKKLSTDWILNSHNMSIWNVNSGECVALKDWLDI